MAPRGRPPAQKVHYYQCVETCDLAYRAPDHRRERWPPNAVIGPPTTHWYRFEPYDEYKAQGVQTRSWLMTARPLAPSFLESRVKPARSAPGGVARQMGVPDAPDQGSGRYHKVNMRTKVKFRELHPSELTEHVRAHAVDACDGPASLQFDESVYEDPKVWMTEEQYEENELKEQERAERARTLIQDAVADIR